jgi:hypothetical protein
MLRAKRRAGDAKREAEAALESAPAPERRLLRSRCAGSIRHAKMTKRAEMPLVYDTTESNSKGP